MKERMKALTATAVTFAVTLAALEGIWCIGNGCVGSIFTALLFVVCGLIVAFLAAVVLILLLGLPALRLLRRFNVEQPFEICAMASIVGTVPVLLFWVLSSEQEFPPTQFLVFAFSGLVAGAVYISQTYVVKVGNDS